jgi:TIR domain/PDZ domain
MADIFISYASEDRNRAEEVARALSAWGWSVWWDRKIPLGKSYDEVIEKALGASNCAIVLWSAVSVASEWVRNEASEAKRRGILVPVFLETIDAPLAFRLLNGADLHDWQPGTPHDEFDQLVERVEELLQKPASTAFPESSSRIGYLQGDRREKRGGQPVWVFLSVGAVAIAVLAGAAFFLYPNNGEKYDPKKSKDIDTIATEMTSPNSNPSDLEKALRGLPAGGLGVPGTVATTAFHVPDLGIRVAFIDRRLSESMLGSMPTGALVMEVEGSGAASKAGIHVFDVIEGIGGHKIETVDDLRQSIRKLGAGKTQFILKSPNGRKTVTVDCPKCKPE